MFILFLHSVSRQPLKYWDLEKRTDTVCGGAVVPKQVSVDLPGEPAPPRSRILQTGDKWVWVWYLWILHVFLGFRVTEKCHYIGRDMQERFE